jgi:Domain of unknown function (DUF4865)
MIAAVIRFVLPAVTDWNSMRALARQRANTFYRHVPGLRTKAFIINPEQRIYGGLYVWENREAMNEFLKSEGFLSLVQKLGQQPEIQIYDVAAYIEQGEVVDVPGGAATIR